MNKAQKCPACEGRTVEEFYRLDAIPTQSCILLENAEEARHFPTGSLAMSVCHDCGFIYNASFDPIQIDYSKPTEESQHFSDTFHHFATRLITELDDRYGLEGRKALEIGCGKGDFLKMLSQKTGAACLGIDPGFDPTRRQSQSPNLSFRREYFDPARIDMEPDLIVCRHTLEHIPAVGAFIGDIASVVGGRKDVPVFLEIPDVSRILEEGAFWDIYYEHCSYFSRYTLARLLRRHGFNVTENRLDYGEQYIILHAKLSDWGSLGEEAHVQESIRPLIGRFQEKTSEKRHSWGDRLRSWCRFGQKVALWGGGSKAVAFLSALGINDLNLQVIDINPFKQGKFLPGSGIEVVGPEALPEAPPDVVIAMNPLYLKEIRQKLATVRISPQLLSL